MILDKPSTRPRLLTIGRGARGEQGKVRLLEETGKKDRGTRYTKQSRWMIGKDSACLSKFLRQTTDSYRTQLHYAGTAETGFLACLVLFSAVAVLLYPLLGVQVALFTIIITNSDSSC